LENQQPNTTSSRGAPGEGEDPEDRSVQAGVTPSDHCSPIAARLDKARKDLLDLSLRNPLLNYRLLKTRGLRLLSPNAAEIFRYLVLEERSLSFLSAAPEDDAADRANAELEQSPSEPSADAAEEQGSSSRRRIIRVRTPHSSEDLQQRLVGTYRFARTAMEEQGVNILFVVLGMLNWYESDSSEEPRAAPLVLVPITLERSARGTAFRAQYDGGDVGVNLSLLTKLKAEFGIELPEAPLFESTDDLLAYFDEVKRAVGNQARWSVDSEASAVGFFSFNKFLMYHDLDPHACTSEEGGPGSALLRALLGEGFSATPDGAVDEADLDKILDPQEIFHVYDADSTQTAAILDARQAPCLVIQGPPGTGKSQTITNLIAEAVGNGSTVLFVAEKRAALEVVQRRLANAGLSDICLELHSNKTDKRVVLAELKRTLELWRPTEPAVRESVMKLVTDRDRLNAYCAAMNTPVGCSSTTPYEALGNLLRLRKRVHTAALPDSISNFCTDGWTLEDFRRRTRLLREIEGLLREIGDPTANPFWGSKRQVYLPRDRDLVSRAATDAEKVLVDLLGRCTQLSEALSGRAIEDLHALDEALAIGEVLTSRPCLDGIALRHHAWVTEGERILKLLSMAERLSEIQKRRQKQLVPAAWQYDLRALQGIHQVLERTGQRWYRHFFPSYRKAVGELATLFVGECPASSHKQLLAVVEDLMQAQAIGKELQQADELLQEVFGSRWSNKASHLGELTEVAKWLVQVHKQIAAGKLPGDVLDFLERGADVASIARCQGEARAVRDSYIAALSHAIRTTLDPDGVADEHDLWQQPFAVQQKTLRDWRKNPEALKDVVDYNKYVTDLEQEGLQDWVTFIPTWKPQDGSLPDLLAFAWYNSVLNKAFRERDALARFRGAQHNEILEDFRNLDRERLKINRSRVALAHWECCQKARTGGTSGQVGVLMQEFGKKRRHLPLRKLLEQAGNAVQQIKPVFMMSPLSVAALIPKGTVQFDLVIFDEASQVRPVDAFGSILRGKKAIVIGDKQQLPPTTFFDRLSELDGEDEDEALENPADMESILDPSQPPAPVAISHGLENPADMESILDLFLAKGAPERMLRWHYRSLHHSLIAVSNSEFYDNKLVIFPNPVQRTDDRGVVLHYNPDTVYVPGARRAHNPKEAEAIARAVMRHAMDFPDLTLGVVAFSLSQAHLIEDCIERERRLGDPLDGFFNGHPEEPFFVKNLENVQGDERDVMFISVGYGKQQDGKLLRKFGPLNHKGGERRLNVLITRARYRCEVFCNFRADDLRLERGAERGVVALKRYLQYAETGKLEVVQPSDREPDSPFEEEVAERLREAGYEVHNQIGTSGYFVDLGVVDPSHPGRYLVGIECDGRSYHSAKWARDRDRLRQEVLEARGWRIYRVWSTDWFNDPEREAHRLIEAIEKAKRTGVHAAPSDDEKSDPDTKAAQGRPGTDGGQVQDNIVRREESGLRPPLKALDVRMYRQADLSSIEFQLRNVAENLHLVSPQTMSNWVRAVVEVESPVHAQIISKRIREAAGLQRTGSRIREAVDQAIRSAAARGLVERRGDFVWTQYAPETEPRDRSQLPSDERRIDFIAPEEIAGAIVMVVRASLGIEMSELVSEVARVFGFGRTSADIEAVISDVVKRMCSSGPLVQRGTHVHVRS
jgi:very-short-patch-repair endonuclease/DNA polymerase III delta prime subunit